MSGKLPALTGAEVIRALERGGLNLVPKLRLGTHSGKLCFPSGSRRRSLLTRNRVSRTHSQTEFGNEVKPALVGDSRSRTPRRLAPAEQPQKYSRTPPPKRLSQSSAPAAAGRPSGSADTSSSKNGRCHSTYTPRCRRTRTGCRSAPRRQGQHVGQVLRRRPEQRRDDERGVGDEHGTR